MKVVRKKDTLQEFIEEYQHDSKRIALVPTMGALHKGHISLVELAKKYSDIVVVSIFVNPTQFGEGEDYYKYPSNEEEDLRELDENDVDIVYIPSVEEMYPNGFNIVKAKGHTDILCGAYRKGHFDGVATIVSKLFSHVSPDVAIFGEKDYQQLHVIKQLDSYVEIIAAPIVRENDGLAISSRNIYLSDEERKIAPELYRTISLVKKSLSVNDGIKKLHEKGFKVEYLEIRDADTLELTENSSNARIFIAAYLGTTRLIDNV